MCVIVLVEVVLVVLLFKVVRVFEISFVFINLGQIELMWMLQFECVQRMVVDLVKMWMVFLFVLQVGSVGLFMKFLIEVILIMELLCGFSCFMVIFVLRKMLLRLILMVFSYCLQVIVLMVLKWLMFVLLIMMLIGLNCFEIVLKICVQDVLLVMFCFRNRLLLLSLVVVVLFFVMLWLVMVIFVFFLVKCLVVVKLSFFVVLVIRIILFENLFIVFFWIIVVDC